MTIKKDLTVLASFIKTIILFISSVLVLGCVGSPFRISMMSPDELKLQNSYDLCKAYAFSPDQAVKTELIRRKAIPSHEWPLIEKKKIDVGMSEDGLTCSWGAPTKINKTVTNSGISKQWVYRNCYSCSGSYVYTQKGKVTGWQN